MKKTAALLLCVLALLPLLFGCAKDGDEAAENITFTAVIEAVNDNSLLVSTTDDVGFDRASVSFAEDMTPDPDFNFIVGQTVRITILPQIAESYPVQVKAVAFEPAADGQNPDTSAEPGSSAEPDASLPAYEAAFFRADSTGEGRLGLPVRAHSEQGEDGRQQRPPHSRYDHHRPRRSGQIHRRGQSVLSVRTVLWR
jgi:hypothetical protein